MTIPPEIVDRIIDYIHDDPKTLMVCSLVARDWIPSAYFHLFAKLSLFTPDDCVRLTELLNFSPSPLHYCQELTTGLMDDFRKSPHPFGSMAFVQPLLKLFKQMDPFTSLHTLHIRGIPCPTVDFIELLMVISQKIATVNITWCSFRSHHDLWKILRLFPNLQNVHASNLGYSYYNEAGLNIPPNHCHSPPIVSFSVYTHCMGFFLEELAEPPYPLTHLKSLEIHHTDQPQENINLIATKYRDAISTLKFSANSTLGSDIGPHIGMYNSLQTLILGKLELFAAYPLGHRIATSVPSFSWVTTTIEQINSRLNHLVFEIVVTERRDLNAIYWQDIDELLESREQFEDLKVVGVVFLDTIPTKLTWVPGNLHPGVDLRKDMMKRMRRTVKRGLLRCSTRGLRT